MIKSSSFLLPFALLTTAAVPKQDEITVSCVLEEITHSLEGNVPKTGVGLMRFWTGERVYDHWINGRSERLSCRGVCVAANGRIIKIVVKDYSTKKESARYREELRAGEIEIDRVTGNQSARFDVYAKPWQILEDASSRRAKRADEIPDDGGGIGYVDVPEPSVENKVGVEAWQGRCERAEEPREGTKKF